MTEAEWLDCGDPTPMLEYLEGKASDRKFRLFACACCRRIWPVLTDERSRRAVELAERAADHPVPERELDEVSGEAEEAFEDTLDGDDDDEDTPAVLTARAATHAASYASNSPVVRIIDAVEVAQSAAEAAPDGVARESAVQAALVRDIVGNPFRRPAREPSRLTPAVTALCRTIYDRHAFGRMPELAGLLEQAGCREDDLLAHCRSGGPHARGCWVIDLLLGRS